VPNLSELRQERLRKLDMLKQEGINPYPASANRSAVIADFFAAFDEQSKDQTLLGGRIRSIRAHGKAAFIDVEDATGKLQLFLSETDTEKFEFWLSILDEGDFIQAAGSPYLSKTGQKSLKVATLTILTKSLLPLPKEWFGLKDEEERYRRRYLDILLNPDVRDTFIKKARFWQSAREFLHSKGFMEVQTPALESIPGGADAQPFVTHLHALDIELYLRISLELYQKRLIVAGFEKIFEIGRIFRNEGIDKEHLQDYTQLEFYWAYADYRQLMELVKTLYKKLVFDTLGSYTHECQGKQIDWSGAWQTYDYYELMRQLAGLDLHAASVGQLRVKAQEFGLDTTKHLGKGRLVDLIFKKVVRPRLIQPGFLINPPVEVEPLAKRLDQDPSRVQRIQVVACGSELGKGFSELNDPLDQRARMEEQLALREAGDTEAQRLDEDFIEALEYGMPPTAGFGLSERLFAIIVNKPVRETTLFPLMRPKGESRVKN